MQKQLKQKLNIKNVIESNWTRYSPDPASGISLLDCKAEHNLINKLIKFKKKREKNVPKDRHYKIKTTIWDKIKNNVKRFSHLYGLFNGSLVRLSFGNVVRLFFCLFVFACVSLFIASSFICPSACSIIRWFRSSNTEFWTELMNFTQTELYIPITVNFKNVRHHWHDMIWHATYIHTTNAKPALWLSHDE